jgi:hypothetical protein
MTEKLERVVTFVMTVEKEKVGRDDGIMEECRY